MIDIEAYEQRQRQNYSHVMRLRPDLLFKQPLNLASYYSTARAPATAAFRPTMDGGPVPEPHQSTQSDTVAAEHDSKREDGLCVRQELSEPGKRDAAPGRTAGQSFTSRWCFEPCNSKSVKKAHLIPSIVQSPGAMLASGKYNLWQPLNDHFYVASRQTARGLFDHLSLYFDEVVAPVSEAVQKWQQQATRHGGDNSSGGNVLAAASRQDFCERHVSEMDERAARMPIRPCAAAGLPTTEICSSISPGPHECGLLKGLSLHMRTCCTPAGLRIRFWDPADMPTLVRLSDVAASCPVGSEAYACSERMLTIRHNDSASVREEKRAMLQRCKEAGASRMFAGRR